MAVEYTNRIGGTYYLRQGKTKTGKPRYWFATTQDGKGEPVEEIPEGFEIYENPADARVYLRKQRPQLISDAEKQLVEQYVQKLKRSKRYLVGCKDRYITIYESDADIGHLQNRFGGLFNALPLTKELGLDQALINMLDRHYTEMMRFCLVDQERRTFTAERFCFRGSIDDWIHLGGPNILKKLAI